MKGEVGPQGATKKPGIGDGDFRLLREIGPLARGNLSQPIVPVYMEVAIVMVPGNDMDPTGINVTREVADCVFPTNPWLIGQIPGDNQSVKVRPVIGSQACERVPARLGPAIKMNVSDNEGFHFCPF